MRLFGDSEPAVDAQSRIEDIRQTMLDCLTDLGDSQQRAWVWARVLYASDIQALWYLRGDMMTLLSDLLGESAAKTQLSTITDMFVGVLPSAQHSRPSHLSR